VWFPCVGFYVLCRTRFVFLRVCGFRALVFMCYVGPGLFFCECVVFVCWVCGGFWGFYVGWCWFVVGFCVCGGGVVCCVFWVCCWVLCFCRVLVMNCVSLCGVVQFGFVCCCGVVCIGVLMLFRLVWVVVPRFRRFVALV